MEGVEGGEEEPGNKMELSDDKDGSSPNGSTACFIPFRPLLLDWTLALPAGLLMGMSLQSVQLVDLHTRNVLFECGNS